MTPAAARSLLEELTLAWVRDPDTSAEWAGEHEGRWGVRMRQTVRDATTIWFDVGERTVALEAYLLPAPRSGVETVHSLALRRNERSWPAFISTDADGDLYVRARLLIETLDAAAKWPTLIGFRNVICVVVRKVVSVE